MNWSRFGRLGIFHAALVCAAVACAPGKAADAPQAAAAQPVVHATQPEDQLDEVVVTATQSRLRELRQAAEKAEDAFYERYNEVNKDDVFDVDCHVDKEGLFRRHRCIGVYVERAQQTDARQVADISRHCDMDLQDLVLHGGCGYIPMADVIADGRKKEFAESLLKAIQSDGRLRELAKTKEQLDLQIQRTRARLFGKDEP